MPEAIWIRPFIKLKAIKNSKATNTILNNNTKVDDAIVITPNRLIDDEHKFRSKGFWIAVVLTVVSVGALIKLGLWQLERGNEKLRYEQQLIERAKQSPQSLDIVISEWKDSRTQAQDSSEQPFLNGLKVDVELETPSGLVVLLDNQINQGTVGYVIYMLGEVPTQDGSKQLLIDLGFVAASNDRRELPQVGHVTLPTNMSGRLYTRSVNPLSHELGLENTTPNRIQNLNIAALSEYTGQDVLPFIFQPQSLDSWPYEMLWRPTAMKSEKHFGYSFQWFVMAAVLLFLMLLIGFRYLKKNSHMNQK
ncbi:MULTISPECIES: SURF1 family protein [Vibrio]|uniref:SURF1 family protein n=2 Tax=Vibrionaceae TaxID=641 RepID=UPI000C85F577|nr:MULTISPECIES: SURF1 family protein [unclassified Vibrio]PTO97253.1 cytochrome oxidase biogenesis protein [Vibrio sp. 10N.286.48.B8]PTP05888.1 cytochrome oxidase biogenesis protein [Vibrio sp. 10N.286.45.A3]PTP13870.1 cytochrome oxidase biogenesis protein [Vibrio sp. 10N.286.51.C3]PTQ01130.1 cytochrome oxidase biogenesis protein [Vibrio sp. ZF 223]PTQ24117.1 cytochrome oxidase biogenesis protein [Vibrio sp. 10N.286.46.E10]